jgi:hypothetical protein
VDDDLITSNFLFFGPSFSSLSKEQLYLILGNPIFDRIAAGFSDPGGMNDMPVTSLDGFRKFVDLLMKYGEDDFVWQGIFKLIKALSITLLPLSMFELVDMLMSCAHGRIPDEFLDFYAQHINRSACAARGLDENDVSSVWLLLACKFATRLLPSMTFLHSLDCRELLQGLTDRRTRSAVYDLLLDCLSFADDDSRTAILAGIEEHYRLLHSDLRKHTMTIPVLANAVFESHSSVRDKVEKMIELRLTLAERGEFARSDLKAFYSAFSQYLREMTPEKSSFGKAYILTAIERFPIREDFRADKHLQFFVLLLREFSEDEQVELLRKFGNAGNFEDYLLWDI